MSLPKLKWSSVFIIKGHSIESKALRKSRDVRMLGKFCRLVYFIMSLISRNCCRLSSDLRHSLIVFNCLGYSLGKFSHTEEVTISGM